VLHAVCAANGKGTDLCLDEFTKAGLINALDKCTKIFITDEADMTFVDAGLFDGFSKSSAEANCRGMFHFVTISSSSIIFIVVSALIMMLYDRISSPYTRCLANKTVTIEHSKLNLLVRRQYT
jgi:hypothetical protein